jgi:hypothetical protein
MNIPQDIDAAISDGRRAQGDGYEGRVIAFTDQPTVTMLLDDGTQRHVVLGVFRDRWRIMAPPSLQSIERADRLLRRIGVNPLTVDVDIIERIIDATARELDAQAGPR